MKRKLEPAFGLNSKKSGNEISKKLKRGESSLILCPSNCINNIGDSLKGKQVNIALSSTNETDCIICYQDFSHLSDSNGSINGSYPNKNLLENDSEESEVLVTNIVYTNNTKTSIQEKPNIDSSEEVSKSFATKDLDDSGGTKNSRSLENRDKQRKEVNLLLSYSKGDHLARSIIPIGPKFQADVPKWEGSIKKRHHHDEDVDDNDSKGLGTQTWPMKGRTMKTNARAIGKGKPNLSKCNFLGSVNCANVDSLEEALKSCGKEDLNDSSGTNNSKVLENKDKQLKEATNLLLSYSNDDHFSRLVIPIGPKFQADVPKWEGSIKKRHQEDDDDTSAKWLGTQIWPMKGRTMKTNAKAVGKGRPSLCKCDFPGSFNCVKQHISEARLQLRYDIGLTFLSWKFNEMGENVSKSWTLKEEKKFKSLVKWNPLSSKINFWKLACKNFPSKSMKSLVSYYYNVYIPRRMGLHIRSSFGEVESDDD